MPIDKVYKIIKEGRGKHFDPNITDKFLSNWDTMIMIYNKYL